MVPISESAKKVFKTGGVFVPSPLALDARGHQNEAYQRLLTLYYIKSGAKAVIPGAHTGEFALNDLQLLDRWMLWIKEMTNSYGKDMVLLAMVGGDQVMAQAEAAIKHGYHAVMIAPTAFSGKKGDEVIKLFETIAAGIPTLAFELQRAIPGSYVFTHELWSGIFDLVYGAKGASFDTYRSLVMLEAAARSPRKQELTLFTGNDDRIVDDLLGCYSFQTERGVSTVHYSGGLLGHFATDTRAAAQWCQAALHKRATGDWDFSLSETALAHAVNRCNMELFDALGNFENSVWGVKHRLVTLGLLPGPYCLYERGRAGQGKGIDAIYAEYPNLSDQVFVNEILTDLKREVGL